jgi:SAM-dependent methyltransferase
MRVLESTLMRMFGRPTGTLGTLGGIIMARTNAAFARSVISLLEVQPSDKVLELGFGPGVGIQLLAKSAPAGRVAGVDCSKEMVEQARARDAQAIESGVVDLRHGSVENRRSKAAPSMRCWRQLHASLARRHGRTA